MGDEPDNVNTEGGEVDPQAEMKTNNKEFIHLLKEKKQAEDALAEKINELHRVGGRNYELMQRVEQLEKELAETKEHKKAMEKKHKEETLKAVENMPHEMGSTANISKLKKMRPKTGVKHANTRLKPRKKAATASNKNLKKETEAEAHQANEKDTYKYYEEIAQRYPQLRLSVLMAAEKKFIDADVNADGTIDAQELDKILESGNMLFTKQQVMDIVKEIDSDGSNDLDFMECLVVIDRLHQNKKTALPTTLEQNKSTVCVIQ
ncbi:uncharacterized protein LOC100891350 [Strongylocentrotus purpuratus]|uniref:EF-hand domain-containing protein n=1 Tax=Strongylocentrotus purpuratus TaxID=7668 RepID=A0A7M7PSP5_STRPU|nr:uncharacterized protein LOC100891350 [Strongylocentrotus purpuratus]